MESDARFYRRRANEEIAAAHRAITPAARERRMQLAEVFLERLKASEARDLVFESGVTATASGKFDPPIFDLGTQAIAQDA